MRIHLYTISWNEMRMLGYFFRHYDPWIERYVFFDDGSTDGTLDTLNRHPRVEVRALPHSDPHSYVRSARDLSDLVWKESRAAADWGIVTAVDEHLHHPDFGGYLASMRRAGVTAIPALGFEMVSADFPSTDGRLAETLTRGAPEPLWNKLNLFDPNAIEETNYTPGRHQAAPTGTIVYPPTDEMLLLHYKYIGFDYVHRRHATLATGLGKTDRENQWGYQFDFTAPELTAKIAKLEGAALDVSDLARAYASHGPSRWWR